MQNARAALKAVAQQDKAKVESEGATAGFAVRSDAAAKEEEMRKAKQAKEEQAKRGREEAAAAQAAGRVGVAQKAEEAARAKEAARAGGAEQAALEHERAQKLKSANSSFEAGRLMVKKVKYREAEAAFRTALQIRSEVLGKRHEEVLKVQTELGEVCIRQDNHVEAARLLHEVYDSYLAAKGQADVMTLKVVHLLGNALSAGARYEEAEMLLKLTIDACALQYGPSAKNTLVFKTGLGLLFDKQDRLEDAEPLLREALAARRRAALVTVVSGTHDVNDLCASMGSLAVVLQKRKQPGPLAEAEALYREALELTRKHDEGKESRTSIGLMNNLAALLKPEASRSDEVEQLLRQCIKAEKELYGPSDDATLNTTEQLASLLHHTRGLHAQAEELLRDVLQERRAALGLGHESTITTMVNLASVFRAMGQTPQSEALLKEAHEASLKALGAGHYKTKLIERDLTGLGAGPKGTGGSFVSKGFDMTIKTLGVASGWQELFDNCDNSDASLEEAFAKVDTDTSGKIDAKELKAYIQSKYKSNGLDDKTIEIMMAAADTNKDGEIDLDEFKMIMRAGAGPGAGPSVETEEESFRAGAL